MRVLETREQHSKTDKLHILNDIWVDFEIDIDRKCITNTYVYVINDNKIEETHICKSGQYDVLKTILSIEIRKRKTKLSQELVKRIVNKYNYLCSKEYDRYINNKF